MSGLRALRIDAWRERIRASLFFVPVLFAVVGVALAELNVWIDERLAANNVDLPVSFTSTVDGARSLLTTVATATITVAGIAFSVSLLVLQLASTQYSPRIVHGLFRDPFNRRVIGIVIGTFSYCLIVLRSARALESSSDAAVPAISIAAATLFGLVSLLATVAFIDHSAHSMEISELLHRITDESRDQLEARGRLGVGDGLHDPSRWWSTDGDGLVVRASRHGWVQQMDPARVLDAVADGSTVRLEITAGRYVAQGTPLCTIWPIPPDADQEPVCRAVVGAVHLGRTRTMQQDIAYGVRQLADVAIKALSTGVNDPTTAQDAIFHLTAVLQAALSCPEPVPLQNDRGSVLIPAEDRTHASLISTAYDEVRRDAAGRPTVCIYLLESIHLLLESLPAGQTTDSARRALREQARLVVAGCERTDQLPSDIAAVREAYRVRFGE